MSASLVMNGKTFDEYFCPGQARCEDQLKNSHDLSLWIPPVLRNEKET
ncbi:hypothetical protein LFL96_03360 [Paraburkholderia sp. D15]|nr:hypothetical protein [Paraburkholderia sp. D15]WGS51918.1 hypothetical protein LFL96_03360 [Paraburkholderia sp. D15]